MSPITPTTTHLEWQEPWPALDAEGKEVVAHITLRASAQDCINLMRAALIDRRPNMPRTDENLLDEFIVTHWATPISPPPPPPPSQQETVENNPRTAI